MGYNFGQQKFLFFSKCGDSYPGVEITAGCLWKLTQNLLEPAREKSFFNKKADCKVLTH